MIKEQDGRDHHRYPRCVENHNFPWAPLDKRRTSTVAGTVVGVPWNHGKHDQDPLGEATPVVSMDPIDEQVSLDLHTKKSDIKARKTGNDRMHSRQEDLLWAVRVDLKNVAKWMRCFLGGEFPGREIMNARTRCGPRGEERRRRYELGEGGRGVG